MTAVRTLSLVAAALTTGIMSGFFYAYSSSVTLGLGRLPDAQYVAAMQEINASVRNGLFAFGFFGAVLFLLLTLLLHARRPLSGRFLLVALACALYVGGGLLLTVLVNVPLNEELASVSGGSASALADARAGYEDAWNFWNGVRALCSSLALLALIGACLLRPAR